MLVFLSKFMSKLGEAWVEPEEPKRIHYIKAYELDVSPTDKVEFNDYPLKIEFEAPVGNIVGLFVERNERLVKKHPQLIIDHTKRFTGTFKYSILIFKDGQEGNLPLGYDYIGTMARPDSLGKYHHVYAASINKDGENILVPR